MRVILLFVAFAGCSFTGSPSGGNPSSDAMVPTPDGAPSADAPTMLVDAPPVPPDAPPDAPPAPNSCGAGYVAVAGAGTSTYRKVNAPTRSWAVAVMDCADDGNGAHLVIPATQAEAEALHDFVDPADNSPYYWAGVSDMDDNGTWVDVLNQPYPNPPWASNEPDSDDCMLVGNDGLHYDFTCTAVQEYACECPS